MESVTGSPSAASTALRLARRLVPVAFFGFALWALHQSLRDYHYGDIAAAFRELPSERLALALAIAICGYLVLAGYDLLAFRFIGRTLRLRDFALASFISNALGNNLGNILLTGAAVRYWIYTSLGISAAEVAKVVLFCSLGFWLGFVALGALLFIFVPIAVPAALHLPAATTRPIGFVLLALLGLYLVLVGTRRTSPRLGAWQLTLPSPGLTAGQLIVASLDLCLMGLALYALLPVTLDWSYPRFMAIFLLALVCGTASQVPGGFGVFETVVILLSPRAATVGVAAALLAFRGIYFILPLFVATTLVGLRERRKYAPGLRGFLEVLFAAAHLLRPMRPSPAPPGAADIERARPIVEQSVQTYANLVFRGDKALLFSQPGNAFLMYGRMGRSWIAMGDPIGPEDEARELLWQFRDLCDRFDGWCVFFEVRPEHLGLYAELGLALTQLGEEARVDLARFSLDGPAHRDLRQSRSTLLRGGCRFEILPREAVSTALPALAHVSDAWLARKATREKGFSNASFDARYLTYFPLAVVRKDDEIIAFANLWLGAGKEELSVDLMRHLPHAPNGTMDFLFTELLLWGRQEGYRWFNFGMAPLSGLNTHSDSPLWHRFGNFVYRHGEHFYNFHGLRCYKQKFDPVWTPLYLASPGGIALPAILIDVTALIAGGLTGIVLKQAGATEHRR